MEAFEQFYQAAHELDLITEDGFFGEKARLLNERRDQEASDLFLYECLMDIFSEPQYGTNNVIDIMSLLLELFTEAIATGGQNAVDIMTAFIKGTKDNPELECMSSYTEYITSNVEMKNIAKLKNGNNISAVDKRLFASKLLTCYSKGVELVGKAFSQLLSLEQIINKEQYNLYENYQLTIYEKVKRFSTLSGGKYDVLTNIIDRNIRNADSHLNAYFSIKENAYIMKVKITHANGKRKFDTLKIKGDVMIREVYPKIGWFVQGYISACILVVLVYINKEKYNEAIKNIGIVYHTLSTGK